MNIELIPSSVKNCWEEAGLGGKGMSQLTCCLASTPIAEFPAGWLPVLRVWGEPGRAVSVAPGMMRHWPAGMLHLSAFDGRAQPWPAPLGEGHYTVHSATTPVHCDAAPSRIAKAPGP